MKKHKYLYLALLDRNDIHPWLWHFILPKHEYNFKQGKFDEFISPDEGLFERNMYITKHKSHLSNP